MAQVAKEALLDTQPLPGRSESAKACTALQLQNSRKLCDPKQFGPLGLKVAAMQHRLAGDFAEIVFQPASAGCNGSTRHSAAGERQAKQGQGPATAAATPSDFDMPPHCHSFPFCCTLLRDVDASAFMPLSS